MTLTCRCPPQTPVSCLPPMTASGSTSALPPPKTSISTGRVTGDTLVLQDMLIRSYGGRVSGAGRRVLALERCVSLILLTQRQSLLSPLHPPGHVSPGLVAFPKMTPNPLLKVKEYVFVYTPLRSCEAFCRSAVNILMQSWWFVKKTEEKLLDDSCDG